jgi:hypothetical protein
MYGTGPAGGISALAVTAGVGSVAYAGSHTLSYMLVAIAAVPIGLVLLRLAFHRGSKGNKRKGRP